MRWCAPIAVGGRTGSHNQGEIAARFGVTVTPATDFLAFDASDTLRAMLDCKATNDGGIARDKANRFRVLQDRLADLLAVAELISPELRDYIASSSTVQARLGDLPT